MDNRGTVIELLLLLVVGVFILGGVYVYSTKSSVDETVQPTPSPTTSVKRDEELGSITKLTPTPTLLPKVSAIPTDSGDADVDEAAKEVNKLLEDVDGLDDVSADLSGLEADFSEPQL